MGLFDKISKAVKIAEDFLDDGKINNSNSSSSKSGQTAVSNSAKPYNKPAVNNAKTTPQEVLASGSEPIGNMQIAENSFYDGADSNTLIKTHFEIPENFSEFDSNAEPESCYMYMADEDFSLERPVFCITPEDYAYNAVKEFRSSGKVSGVSDFQSVDDPNDKALFKAKKTDYFGQTVYFYGVERGIDRNPVGFSMIYCNDVIGTPLENKLMKILDHVVETYNETITND
ncbi:MAG: hypothetical protein ACI4I6_03145 [Hominimerdicola sp.]